MAAYLKSMRCLVAIERHLLANRGGYIIVQPKRFVRGLRRNPVRVLSPDDGTDKAPKATAQTRRAGQNVRKEKDARVVATESEAVKARSTLQSAVKEADIGGIKNHIDGVRFERASLGDKRLG